MAAVCMRRIIQPSPSKAAQSANVVLTSDTGMGGGLYAYIVQPLPSAAAQSKTTKAIYGGGVALNNSTINPITNWKVIGNEAYKTKVVMAVMAAVFIGQCVDDCFRRIKPDLQQYGDRHGADICLESWVLQSDCSMLRVWARLILTAGINIDGWCITTTRDIIPLKTARWMQV